MCRGCTTCRQLEDIVAVMNKASKKLERTPIREQTGEESA